MMENAHPYHPMRVTSNANGTCPIPNIKLDEDILIDQFKMCVCFHSPSGFRGRRCEMVPPMMTTVTSITNVTAVYSTTMSTSTSSSSAKQTKQSSTSTTTIAPDTEFENDNSSQGLDEIDNEA